MNAIVPENRYFRRRSTADRWVSLAIEAWDWHAWLKGGLNLETVVNMPAPMLEETR